VDRRGAPRLVHGGEGRHRVRDQVRAVVLAGLAQVHDPNAIDTVRFRMSVAFVWPAIAKPRRRRSRPS
jgi:IS4 transposase